MAVAVHAIKPALKLYRDGLGGEYLMGGDVAGTWRWVQLRFPGGGKVELLEPLGEGFLSRFLEKHGQKAPPFIISDFVVCVDTEAEVIEYTDEYFAKQFYQVANHYEWGGEHFKHMPSYSTYVALGDAMNAAGGPEKAYKGYIAGNLIGTPEQLYEKHLARKAMVGDYEIIANFSYGGMPYERVYAQMKRFADKVMPRLRENAAAERVAAE